MAAYADYTFYTTTFLGAAIAETAFDRLALRASEAIDQITFERAAPVVEADTDTATIARIQLATCAVAEAIQAKENGAGQITAEKVGSYSVTYASGVAKSDLQRLIDAARPYLTSTGLMYRGFHADEL